MSFLGMKNHQYEKYFHFDDFACPFIQIKHRHCRFILFVDIIIAMRGAHLPSPPPPPFKVYFAAHRY